MYRYYPTDPVYEMIDASTMKKSYSLGPVIGEGAFGSVRAGTRVSDSLPVAIKIIDKQRVTVDPFDEHIPMEVSLLHKLSHIPGVIQLLSCSPDRQFQRSIGGLNHLPLITGRN